MGDMAYTFILGSIVGAGAMIWWVNWYEWRLKQKATPTVINRHSYIIDGERVSYETLTDEMDVRDERTET